MKKMLIQDILDYIEDHIEDPLSAESLAYYAGYSKFYLHKLFSIYTGMQLMSYTRQRKLAHSLRALQAGLPIVEIAIQYGFQSARSYRRAFQRQYGFNPRHEASALLTCPPKLQLDHIGGISMLAYLSETREVILPKIYGLSAKAISKHCEHDVIDEMTVYGLTHGIWPITTLGFDIPVTPEEEEKGLRGYEYWLVVDENTFRSHEPQGHVEKKILEKSTYLMVTIEQPFLDPFERIPAGWKKLWAAVEDKYAFKKDFPVYGFEEKVETLSATTMNIYIPLEK